VVDCRGNGGVVVRVLWLLDSWVGGVGDRRANNWCDCVEAAVDEGTCGRCFDLQAMGIVAEFSLRAAALP